MHSDEIINQLKVLATADHLGKLAHFGVKTDRALGVKVPLLRQLAKSIGKSHPLALELWATEVHEARLLASMIDLPGLVTEAQFDAWVYDFDSWDLCDSVCDLLVKTPFCLPKIEEYSTREDEFVKRTAFTLMCKLAFHDKKSSNELFQPFWGMIEREAWDDRNFVRKAVNWALRQIGKRNEVLRLEGIAVAKVILLQNTKSARWIAKDALRELMDEKVVARIAERRNGSYGLKTKE